MNKAKFLGIFCGAVLLFIYAASGEEGANLLSGTYTAEKLREVLVSPEDWHPYPRISERVSWEKIPQKVRNASIRRAETFLDGEWETPKASVFLEYVRNGNRSNFQSVSFGRRAQLAELVLGECMEGEGRFLDDILDGIWTICEETYWGVPAHVGAQKRGSGLPDVTEPTVDLFAAETGMLLAWADYLLGQKLDEISPLIRERIRYEVNRRIIDVNLARDDFWWMGFSGQTVNNWNPWICSNWLAAVLILEEDPGRRIDSVHRILRCLDNFLNPYPRDGGCDEGPGYWDRAGGSLFDCLELLSSASDGAIDVFDEPLIQEIGRYIYRVYISDRYFINFADAAAKLTANASVIFRYGQSIGDEAMTAFGAFLAGQQALGEEEIRGNFGWMGRILPALFHLDELLSAEAREPLSRDFWFQELQVMGARSYQGSNRSFYVAAKGGHNAESHNHNDVGNFIVYADGLPVLIDVGVETYTAKTFSSQRYEIWTMQSAYHNLPTINGVIQKDGSKYRAEQVSYESDDKKAVFSLDLAGAYPEEAGVELWSRSITLNRGKNVIVQDLYALNEVRESLKMTLMSWCKPELEAAGRIRLVFPSEVADSNPVFVHFDEKKFSPEIETISLEDGRLNASWGNRIYRIVFSAKDRLLKDSFSLRIE